MKTWFLDLETFFFKLVARRIQRWVLGLWNIKTSREISKKQQTFQAQRVCGRRAHHMYTKTHTHTHMHAHKEHTRAHARKQSKSAPITALAELEPDDLIMEISTFSANLTPFKENKTPQKIVHSDENQWEWESMDARRAILNCFVQLVKSRWPCYPDVNTCKLVRPVWFPSCDMRPRGHRVSAVNTELVFIHPIPTHYRQL